MEDLWKRAKSFAEEAAKKSQTITTSSASTKISDLVSETAKRSREFVAETSKKTDEIKTAALKQADQAYLYPPDIFFQAGNKGTLSFSGIDTTTFRFEKEDKIRPFFETRNYWGIQRTRTKIKCNGCGRLVGVS